MPTHFADRLLDAIKNKGAPICVGIDPILEMLPDAIAGKATDRDPFDLTACVDAVYAFTTKILDIVAPLVPCVKFQSAYFEKYLWEGVEAYYDLIGEAKARGLIVIGDVKRGDIGSTSDAYATAHLADLAFDDLEDESTPDAITVNPMLGIDTLNPFIDVAVQYGKGLFVLVRTSNPGSTLTQDAKLADGRTWSEMLADSIAPHTESVGTSGFSAIGAVVGATQTQTIASLRARLPRSIFLLPGYGVQGATAEMTRAAFTNGKGAIVSASRSILYAHSNVKNVGRSWEDSVRVAVHEMRDSLAATIS